MRRSWQRTVVALLLGALVNPLHQVNAQPSNFTNTYVTDIQVSDAANDVYWLNSRTVVFAGVDRAAEKLRDFGFHTEKARIYVWKLGSQPKLYAGSSWPVISSARQSYYLCAEENKIYYSTGPIKRLPDHHGWSAEIKSGSIGAETNSNLIHRLGTEWSDQLRSDFIGKHCDQIIASNLNGHTWRSSYARKYIIDFGPIPMDSKGRIQLYANDPPPIKLLDLTSRKEILIRNIPAREIYSGCTQAPSWESSFILWNCIEHADAERAATIPVWKIRTTGSTERITIESGAGQNLKLVPYRNGYFAITWKVDGSSSQQTEETGLNLVENGRLRMLIRGYFTVHAISPDGCFGAFGQSVGFRRGLSVDKLVLINLCQIAESNK